MNKQEFLEGLGSASPEDKITEIVVPEHQAQKVVDEPNVAKPSDTNKDIGKQLASIHTTVAELEGTVKASSAVIQSNEILDTLEELKSRLESLEAEIEAAKCPECGKIIGWHDLEVKQSIKPSYFPVFDLPPFIKPDMESHKECPACGCKEEVEEEQE